MEAIINFFTNNSTYYYLIVTVLAIVAILSTTIIIIDYRNNRHYVKPEVEPEEENKTDIAIEEVMKQMESDLEKKESSPITTFEQEQEEKAIISYQELLAYAGKNKTVENTEEESGELIQDILSNNEIEPLEVDNNIVEEKPDSTSSRFRNTEFISPVYGKTQKGDNESPRMRKEEIIASLKQNNNLSVEEIDDEIKRGTEFLQALKEFRKNL